MEAISCRFQGEAFGDRALLVAVLQAELEQPVPLLVVDELVDVDLEADLLAERHARLAAHGDEDRILAVSPELRRDLDLIGLVLGDRLPVGRVELEVERQILRRVEHRRPGLGLRRRGRQQRGGQDERDESDVPQHGWLPFQGVGYAANSGTRGAGTK
jgi:hypothetical protein